MQISMIGAGYVGLVSGACFAEFGAQVVCIDQDAQRIAALRDGRMPIYEPGLEDLVRRNVAQQRLRFDTVYDAVAGSDLVFIAVGTPSRRGDGHADLSYVYRAAEDIAPRLSGFTVVVDKSTVPVGTAREVERIIRARNPAADFEVAANPEFLRQGAAIADFLRPDRVVIGADGERAQGLLAELYRPLNLIETPMVITDPESAELIKYASNAFLATKISFINEISALCEAVGADVHAIARGMGLDGRIGRKFLHPGPGFGGSCLPKDTRALARMAQERAVALRIVDATIAANGAQQQRMLDKIRRALGGSERGRRLAVLGLAFKPETDDLRDAPALFLLPALLAGGAELVAHDPKALAEARRLLPAGIALHDDAGAALDGADAVILLTEWNAYRGLDLDELRRRMRGRLFIDLRNVYEPERLRAAGFEYHGVGRGTPPAAG
jgi:UDPglucose 6-dehydrogenase